jgi:hypothetical protein
MDIDQLVKEFRLASREMFNHFFRAYDPYSSEAWEQVERFSGLQEVMFQKLVTEPASLTGSVYGKAQTDILVELHDLDRAPVMLNRDEDSGYWDYPVREVMRDAKLLFVAFFDWDQTAYRDNQYVRFQVAEWPSCPEAVGKHGLIEARHVRFVANEQGSQGGEHR